MAKKKAAKPAPRQKNLPGMGDAKIAVLERAALSYADIRDERMVWTEKEVKAKKRVQDLMHEQKRTHYARANIEISLEPEGEKVRVRVKARDLPERPVKEPEPEEEEVEEDEDLPEPENPDDYDTEAEAKEDKNPF